MSTNEASATAGGLGSLRRTDLAGGLRTGDVGRDVVVCGWVHARRDHGGLCFVDVRDHSGILQVVCDPSASPGAHARSQELRLEYVVGFAVAFARDRPKP